MRATLTSKSQLTLPAEVRRRMNLGPGDQIEFRIHEEGWMEVHPVRRPRRPLMELRGLLGPPPNGKSLSLGDIETVIAEAAAEEGAPPGDPTGEERGRDSETPTGRP